MRVVLTAEARDDLERIGDCIAKDNPARARRFVQELIAKTREIGDLPKAYQVVPRHAHLNVRRRMFGSHSIFYRAEADRISIIHILHGAQDYQALLFPDE